MSYIPARLSNLCTKPAEEYKTGHQIAADLTDPQRYGILVVRGGEASTKLRAIMDAMGWPAPGRADWEGLRRLGLVRRRSDRLLHDLLPQGLAVATEVTKDLCRKFNVHVLYIQERKSGFYARNGHCSCGLMNHSEIHGSDGKVEVAFHKHMEHMRHDPGGFETDRRVQAIFDKVAADGAAAWARFKEAGHG
jgi:hypothetical protein